MFHSLDEQIESTVGGRSKRMEHLARLAGVVVLSVVCVRGPVSLNCGPRMMVADGAVPS